MIRINILQADIIFFTRKTNSINFNFWGGDLLILRTHRVKELGVMLDSKLYFLRHFDYLHSQALKLLGLIRYITYSFSSPVSLKVLHVTLIRS
jgi:hypothetical protein